MPAYSAEALILRTYRYGEADLIVVFLTRDRGKRRGVAKNAVKSRRRFGAALEPLTRGRVAYFEKEQRELVRLDQIETLASPLASAMSGNAGSAALGHAGYFAELLDEWSPEAQANEKLFRLGAAVGDALADGAPVAPLARYFEYWLLRLEGVYPDIAGCPRCGDAALHEGAALAVEELLYVCRRCAPHGAGVSAEALAFLREAGATSPSRVGTLRLQEGAARELEAAHRRLIAMHLEKDLRSARVLREIGPDLL
ncbi:MAG: DNA repair protein RecO [Acidobacteriota bacterium]|nr:DNA repair protein RecO [Acidobacteriota bacterium]